MGEPNRRARPRHLGRLPRERTAHVFDGVPASSATAPRRCGAPPTAATAGASTAARPSAASASKPPPGAPSTTRSCRACASTRSCPATTTAPRTSHDMANDGVDVSIVYPNNAIFIYIEPDRELALACMRSYNDWVLDEFQGAAPDHIVGLPMLPVDDGIDVCIAELDRCLAKGARGGLHPGLPGPAVPRPVLRPAVRARGRSRRAAHVPPHVRRRAVRSRLRRAGRAEDLGRRHRVPVLRRGAAVHVHGDRRRVRSSSRTCAIVAAEVNCGWLPFWAQTMEQNLDIRAGLDDRDRRRRRRRPPSCSGATCSSPCSTTTSASGSCRDYPWLVDASMYSTDYPHSVTLWPKLEASTSPRLTADLLSEESRGRCWPGTPSACSVSDATRPQRAFALGDGRTSVPEPDVKAALAAARRGDARRGRDRGRERRLERGRRVRRPARGEGVRARDRAQERRRRGAPRRRTARELAGVPGRRHGRVLAGHGHHARRLPGGGAVRRERRASS